MSLPAHRLASLAAHAALGDEEVLVQGVIDCLVHVGDEIVLIDYKSDRLTEKELASPLLAAEKLWQSHGAQMGYYAAAVRYVFGKYPSRCLLYSMPLGDAVEKSVKECLQYANLLEDEPYESE
jgi:ATP-dependent helicase/nuclease subunit A